MKSITEEQYELLKPYLPIQRGNVKISNTTLINAVLYVAENSCKWRALPKEFGNWHTIYTRLRRWAEKGVLERLFEALQQHHLIQINVECLSLDSTSVKVHPDGTGALKKTAHNPLENPEEDGPPKFIWWPPMIDWP
jgi:transposase